MLGSRVALIGVLILAVSLAAGRARGDNSIEEGRRLFIGETFGGNGRTCATCHPPDSARSRIRHRDAAGDRSRSAPGDRLVRTAVEPGVGALLGIAVRSMGVGRGAPSAQSGVGAVGPPIILAMGP
jgi:hypothetical protein